MPALGNGLEAKLIHIISAVFRFRVEGSHCQFTASGLVTLKEEALPITMTVGYLDLASHLPLYRCLVLGFWAKGLGIRI